MEKDAAIMIKESDLNTFKSVFVELLEDKAERDYLSKNISSMALPDATERIVNEIEKILKK